MVGPRSHRWQVEGSRWLWRGVTGQGPYNLASQERPLWRRLHWSRNLKKQESAKLRTVGGKYGGKQDCRQRKQHVERPWVGKKLEMLEEPQAGEFAGAQQTTGQWRERWGLRGKWELDFVGLCRPGKDSGFFFPHGQWEAIARRSTLALDAAVCFADFVNSTDFRLLSTFQDTSMTPYLISCGATQTAPIVCHLTPSPAAYAPQLRRLPPSTERPASRPQAFLSLQPVQLTRTAGQTPYHSSAMDPKEP